MKGLFSGKIQIVTCLQEFAIIWILEVLKLISMRFEKPVTRESATPNSICWTSECSSFLTIIVQTQIFECMSTVCFTRIYFLFEMVKMNLTEYPYLYKGSYIYLLF